MYVFILIFYIQKNCFILMIIYYLKYYLLQAGIKDPEMFKEAKNILLDIAYLIQVRDDYLGCFGNYETIRKISTDIEEGKCSWVVVTALERVTPEQRKILEVNTIDYMIFVKCFYQTLSY